MNLLVTIDENYLLPCEVMLHSLFAGDPNAKEVSVYLLHSSMPPKKLEELRRCCACYGATLIPVAVDPSLFADAPVSKRYPKEMYYRLLSSLILPLDIDRVLYLDPDILIVNPITPLWELDLGGNIFAAASHTGLTEMTNGINHARLNTEHPYFNTGVMLIDLNAARRVVTAEDIFDCVSAHEKELILPDQDVFNMLYGGYTLPVDDAVWNYDARKYSKYMIRSSGKRDLNWVMANTAILHFCGRHKPWNEDYRNPFGMLYRHYMNLSSRMLQEQNPQPTTVQII